MGKRLLRVPTLVLGLLGAAAGILTILLPVLLLVLVIEHRMPTPGITHSPVLSWSYMLGWPAFCASLGAAGMMLYRWRLSRTVFLEGTTVEQSR
jgi:hypothetical protein